MSSTTTLTRWVISNAWALRISTPCSAPFPVPTMMAVGVANPRAQGHAMIRMATNTRTAKVRDGSGPNNIQNRNAARAIPITAGTK